MWNVLVEEDKCTGCGECIDDCPGDVYELIDSKAVPSNIDECHGCSTCADVCPEDAITIEEV